MTGGKGIGTTGTARLLLRPKVIGFLPRGRGGSPGRLAVVAVAGVLGFGLVYGVSVRLLASLRNVPEVGPLLAGKMLGLGLLLLLAILLLANLIGALSSFFLARDLPGILASPADGLSVYAARLGETLTSSSWMVVLLIVPVLAAYQHVYGGGPTFYLVAAVALPPFLLIPAAAGSAATLLLVRLLPARRTRDLLGVIGLAAAALLVVGLRLLRPERLVNPESFRSLMDFLALLRGPSSPWLPSEWLAQALLGPLEGRADPFWLLFLWTTAGAALVGGAALHGRLYVSAFTRAQEGARAVVRHAWAWCAAERLLRPLGLRRRELVLKDLRVFFRDATQWSQLLILGVLLVVYVYNMQVLPLRGGEGIGRFLISAITFLNLALAGFVLAAVAARFVFPAFSLEGPSLWLLRSAPLPARDLVWSKFWTGAVPLLALALALTGLTAGVLGVEPSLLLLSLATIAGLTLAFTAQALAWGLALPRFESENAAQIPTSLGGLLFMVGALVTLTVTLGAEVWALRGYLRSGLPGGTPRGPETGEVLLALLLTGVLCWLASWPAYRWARDRTETLER